VSSEKPLLARARSKLPLGARRAVALQLIDVLDCDEGRRLVKNLATVMQLSLDVAELRDQGKFDERLTVDPAAEFCALAEYLTGKLLP